MAVRRRPCVAGPGVWISCLGVLLGACSGGTIEDPSKSWAGLPSDASNPGPAAPGGGTQSAAGSGGSDNPGTPGTGTTGSTAPQECKGAACGTETAVASSAFLRLSHRQWAAS